ncbi:MAG: sensor histidine kinase, partial [Cyclobacteriaceae bacterium]|nr:sensor histidine kinase [Cyclobacteriaceae bacterium]
MKKLVFTICTFLFFISAQASAGETVLNIQDNDAFYNPALNSVFLIDVKNTLKINDIIKPEYQHKFIANTSAIPEFGLISSSIWFKFKIQNRLVPSPYLEILNPALDTIEYFLYNNEGQLVHHHLTGNFKKVEDRAIRSGQLMIDMNLENNAQYTCYLKIKSLSSSTMVPMRIASLMKYYESKHTDTILQGLYFGLILFLVVYNLFLFFSLKDLSYLYFSLFIACIGLLFAIFNGFGIQYIWSDFPKFNQFTPLLGALSGIFIVLFSSSFLNSRIKTPKIHTWLLALTGLYFVIIGLNLFGFQFISTKLVEYNSLVVLFFLLFAAIKAWQGGFEPSKFYLLAWSFFVAGFILLLLRENGWIGINHFTGSILQISSTITILFMSFALSKKINIYIENKNDARALALTAAVENEKLVSNQNQLLEAKVNQRTIDLEQMISTLSKQRKDLHEVNDFKDKVFSIISHDLKSPISTLVGLLKLMKMKSLDEMERGKVVESLEVALKSTKYLLDNILAGANKNNKTQRETNEIELYESVEEVLGLFQYQATIKGIQLNNLVEKSFFIIANK